MMKMPMPTYHLEFGNKNFFREFIKSSFCRVAVGQELQIFGSGGENTPEINEDGRYDK
jgi:hypothetical protein